MDRPRDRVSLRAAALGCLYGSTQAAIRPPFVGFEFSIIVHTFLLVAFMVWLFRRRHRLSGGAAFSGYVLVLLVAAFLPLKFMDTRVEFATQVVSIDEVRAALEREGLFVHSPAPLPARSIQLATVRPSLSQLREALDQQTDLELHPVIECGNTTSVSFLWGLRASGTILYLGRRP